MKSLNQVQLIGNIGADPEVKNYEGKTISKFSLVTNEEWLDKQSGEKRINSEWHKLVCFNKLAEVAKNYLKKGTKIYISGKLKTSKWQDKNNENHFSTEIVVEDLMMLSKKMNQQEEENPHPQ